MNQHTDQLLRLLNHLGDNTTMTAMTPPPITQNIQGTVLRPRYMSSAFYLFIFLLVLAIMVSYCDDCENLDRYDEEDIEAPPAEEGPPSFASKILEMNTAGRMEVYSKAFDDSKNQTVLTPASIVVNSKSDSNSTGTCDTDEEESCGSYQEEDPSIYLALDQVRASLRASSIKLEVPVGTECGCYTAEDNDNGSSNQTCRRRNSSLVHPRSCQMDAEAALSNAESTCGIDNRNLVHGNCAICFEDMKAGETVVWGENKACQHVFHKHCMVSYLSHKKQKLAEIKRDENPCPICRRKFVTVCPPATV